MHCAGRRGEQKIAVRLKTRGGEGYRGKAQGETGRGGCTGGGGGSSEDEQMTRERESAGGNWGNPLQTRRQS